MARRAYEIALAPARWLFHNPAVHSEDGLQGQCSVCQRSKPDLGEITLASKRGWRLERRMSLGVLILEWFCPTCASKRKGPESSR